MIRRLARIFIFWPVVLVLQLGIVLVAHSDRPVLRWTVRPLFRLFCRVLLRARPWPLLRDPKQQVLPNGDLAELLRRQRWLAVIPCACRMGRGEPCGHPLHEPHDDEVCLSLGAVALLQIGSGLGRRLTPEQAILLCRRAAASGQVHHGIYVLGRLEEVCSCCGQHCGVLRSYRAGATAVVRPAPVRAVRGPDCNGCATGVGRLCERLCPYGHAPSSPACQGCGLCARHCPRRAIRLEPRDRAAPAAAAAGGKGD